LDSANHLEHLARGFVDQLFFATPFIFNVAIVLLTFTSPAPLSGTLIDDCPVARLKPTTWKMCDYSVTNIYVKKLALKSFCP